MHPYVVGIIIAGGALFMGIRFWNELLEEREYEQYQRNKDNYEREFNRFHRNNNDFDFDHDQSDTEEDVVIVDKVQDTSVRKRKPFDASFSDDADTYIRKDVDQDQYELSDLETSIAERKRRLMAEQAFLDQEEENLRIRKSALLADFFGDVTSSTNDQPHFSSNSSSDDEDVHSLKHHMALFDPFADRFQEPQNSLSNSDTTEKMMVSAVSSRELEQEPSHISDSAELHFPSPRSNTPTESSATSVTDELHSVSHYDSEESWDAVSELEDWNQSSVYESDSADENDRPRLNH